jgi:DnaK suppressor protein
MKKKVIEKIKKSLLAQKEELLGKKYGEEIDIEGDETDEIQAKLIMTVSSQLLNKDRDKLLQIENALNKIANGSFGGCEECGEAIAEKRLEINPYFATCISCAELKELDSRQKRRG